MRVRGLKHFKGQVGKLILQPSHPVRVRGLKRVLEKIEICAVKSHPVRVRGLKHIPPQPESLADTSHPVRVRGLKHWYIYILLNT